MAVISNIFGLLQETYLPGPSSEVDLDDNGTHSPGSANFNQRCEVMARARSVLTDPVEVLINVGSANNISNVGDGGRTISTSDPPLELYIPGEGFTVWARKLVEDSENVNVFLYSIDGTSEIANTPPIAIEMTESYSATASGTVCNKPTGTADNDLMIALIGVNSNSVIPVLPDGWDWLGDSDSNARVLTDNVSPILRVATRLAASGIGGPGEPSTYSFGKPGESQNWGVAICTVRVESANPADYQDYGINLITSEVSNSGHATSSGVTYGNVLSGQGLSIPEENRLQVGAWGRPALFITLFGAYNSSNPADPLGDMSLWFTDSTVVRGGSDIVANQMVGIGAVCVTAPDSTIEGLQIGGESPFEYQYGTLLLMRI